MCNIAVSVRVKEGMGVVGVGRAVYHVSHGHVHARVRNSQHRTNTPLLMVKIQPCVFKRLAIGQSDLKIGTRPGCRALIGSMTRQLS